MKLPRNAIVTVSACGIFAEPTFKSEMVNQALLNEEVLISDKKDSWYKIKLRHDEYSGWMHEMYLENYDDNSTNLDKDYVSQIKNPIVFQACKMLGKPYLWGGRSFQGYDCSGLVQTSMNLCGINFPRDAREQAVSNLLYEVDFKNAREGDLIFFEKDKVVNHVAILINLIFKQSKFLLEVIHASGSVKISSIRFDVKDLPYGTVDNNLEKKKIKLHKIMRLIEDV